MNYKIKINIKDKNSILHAVPFLDSCFNIYCDGHDVDVYFESEQLSIVKGIILTKHLTCTLFYKNVEGKLVSESYFGGNMYVHHVHHQIIDEDDIKIATGLK